MISKLQENSVVGSTLIDNYAYQNRYCTFPQVSEVRHQQKTKNLKKVAGFVRIPSWSCKGNVGMFFDTTPEN